MSSRVGNNCEVISGYHTAKDRLVGECGQAILSAPHALLTVVDGLILYRVVGRDDSSWFSVFVGLYAD